MQMRELNYQEKSGARASAKNLAVFNAFVRSVRDPPRVRGEKTVAQSFLVFPGHARIQHPSMIHIGTSGFQYAEWRGSFYPADLSKPKMLSFYASHFSTTEINYTFNRLPSQKTLDRWNAATPNGF